MTAPVPSRLPRSTTRGEQPTDSGGDGGREVKDMRERLIEFISWGETDDGQIGHDTARQMLALYDETVAARAAAAPYSCPTCVAVGGPYRCCPHCTDDPPAHEGGQRNHHDLPCTLCIEHPAALLAEQPGGGM